MMPTFFRLLFVASLIAHAAANEAVTLQLKWKHQFQFAGYYAAKELGYYEEAGFDVTFKARDDGESVYKTVLDGRATFAVGDSSIVLQRLNGEPLVVLSTVFQHSPLVLLTLADEQLNTPYALINKTVMFERGIDDAAITAMFVQLGIENAQYKQVITNFNDFALIEDNVDAMAAYSTDQPYRYERQGIKTQIINPASYGIDFYGDLIFSTEAYVNQNPERAKAFADASLRGWAYALENPEQVIDWILQRYNSEKARDELQFEARATIPIVQKSLVPLGTMYSERFERIATVYRDLGMAPKNANIDGLTVTEYLKDQAYELAQTRNAATLLALGFTILVVALWGVNVRLKAVVSQRTTALREANSQLERQLHVIDRNVMSAKLGKKGYFLSASTALCDALGCDEHELVGQHRSTLRHPEYSEEA